MSEMSDRTEVGLPDGVADLLDGRDLRAHVGFTMQLVTVDEAGWPRVALLSVGEVVALDEAHLRLALWPGSHTTDNLARTGHGLLAFVHGGSSHTVRIETGRTTDLGGPHVRATFDAIVVEVRTDEVPYATLTGGITFDLPDPKPVIERWRATVDSLRTNGAGRAG
jgi:hypothetical protein